MAEKEKSNKKARVEKFHEGVSGECPTEANDQNPFTGDSQDSQNDEKDESSE